MIERRVLGRTGFDVARVGISSSFGADEAVFQEAFERGCNYFTWGTFIRGRSGAFKDFIRHQTTAGNREKLVVGLLSYSHSALLGNHFLHSALNALGTDYIDGLILGYFPKRPPNRVLDWALEARARGLVKSIGMTTHNRKIVPPLAEEGIIDYFHIRYNAVHRGAEQEIFPQLTSPRPGLVSFTATCWGKLMDQKKALAGESPPTAGDCYRYVLSNDSIDVCMMGVRDLDMLRENLKAIEKGPMAREELATMRRVGDHLYGKSRT